MKNTIVRIEQGIATVTLNRPEKLNALSSVLMKELVKVFTDLKGNADVAAVILTGSGRAFCAGLDLDELSSKGLDSLSTSEYDIESAILSFDRPIIGAINGVTVTGGFELALWCDILIASEKARFADTHAKVGLLPGWGLSQRLPRLIGIYRARELSFTGNFIDAEKADAWGLVNRVVAEKELLPTCISIAQDISKCDRKTLTRYKRVINEGAGMNLAAALIYERFGMDLHATNR